MNNLVHYHRIRNNFVVAIFYRYNLTGIMAPVVKRIIESHKNYDDAVKAYLETNQQELYINPTIDQYTFLNDHYPDTAINLSKHDLDNIREAGDNIPMKHFSKQEVDDFVIEKLDFHFNIPF